VEHGYLAKYPNLTFKSKRAENAEVHQRLKDAMGRCRSIHQCRDALVRELQTLAKEIATPNTPLNPLVARN